MGKKAFTEWKDEFLQHPDTKVIFDGYYIPYVQDVISAAKRLHELVPQIGCVNWDMSLNETGEPVVIEANVQGGGIWVIEMVHSDGVFEESTEEVLRWLKIMRNIPKTEWGKYAFGKLSR